MNFSCGHTASHGELQGSALSLFVLSYETLCQSYKPELGVVNSACLAVRLMKIIREKGRYQEEMVMADKSAQKLPDSAVACYWLESNNKFKKISRDNFFFAFAQCKQQRTSLTYLK